MKKSALLIAIAISGIFFYNCANKDASEKTRAVENASDSGIQVNGVK